MERTGIDRTKELEVRLRAVQVYPEDSCVFFQRRDGCVMGFRKCRYCRFMWSYNEKEENSQGLCRYKNGGNLL